MYTWDMESIRLMMTGSSSSHGGFPNKLSPIDHNSTNAIANELEINNSVHVHFKNRQRLERTQINTSQSNETRQLPCQFLIHVYIFNSYNWPYNRHKLS